MSHTDAQNMSHTYVFWIIFYKFPWSDDKDDDTNN